MIKFEKTKPLEREYWIEETLHSSGREVRDRGSITILARKFFFPDLIYPTFEELKLVLDRKQVDELLLELQKLKAEMSSSPPTNEIV